MVYIGLYKYTCAVKSDCWNPWGEYRLIDQNEFDLSKIINIKILNVFKRIHIGNKKYTWSVQ